MAATSVWGKFESLNEDTYPDVLLTGDEIWFGRDSSCHPDARFTEAIISKRHCRVYLDTDKPMIEDLSSNGTFVNGVLLGRQVSKSLHDQDIVTLLVPSKESKNFSKNTPIYRFVSIDSTTTVSETQVDEAGRGANSLASRLDKWLKACEEYREGGNIVNAKGTTFLDMLSQDEFADSTTKAIVDNLKKLEEMKFELNKKIQSLITQPISTFKENDVTVLIEMDKTTKATKKKHDEVKSKLKKESDHFKEKQLEQKYSEVKSAYEIQSMTQMNKWKEIQTKANTTVNQMLIQYTLANLEYFKTGYNFLSGLEQEMHKKTADLSNEVKAQEAQLQKSIDKLKALQISGKAPKLRKEKQGYLLKKGKPLWFVIMEGTVSYYKSWKESTPLGSIDLIFCSVKVNAESKKKLCFELVSPQESHVLQAQSIEDLDDWINVFKNSIAFQLESQKKRSSTVTLSMDRTLSSKATPLNQLQEEDSGNLKCVDCNAKEPDWASINIGCLICYECSGVHRAMGTHVSKVRSLTLDKWEPQLLQILKLLGNTRVNQIYEARPSSKYPKPESNTEREKRERYIKAKYNRKRFISNDGTNDPLELSKLLYAAVTTDSETISSLPSMLQFLAFGANVNYANPNESNVTALHYSSAAGNVHIVEFLLQNGANPNAQDSKGYAPIHYAASNNQTGCVRLLMNRGAIVNIKDYSGQTALDVAVATKSEGVQILLSASKTN